MPIEYKPASMMIRSIGLKARYGMFWSLKNNAASPDVPIKMKFIVVFLNTSLRVFLFLSLLIKYFVTNPPAIKIKKNAKHGQKYMKSVPGVI